MRKITREKVMEFLYLLDIRRQVAKSDTLSEFLQESANVTALIEAEKAYLLNKKDDMEYFEATFTGIVEKLPEIDEYIKKYLKSTWSIEQLGFVERTILRLAIYELLWSEQEGLVTSVVIAASLEIAEKYTDETSMKLIHGILGGIANNLSPKETTKKSFGDNYKKVDKSKNKANVSKFKAMRKAQRLATDAQAKEALDKETVEGINAVISENTITE